MYQRLLQIKGPKEQSYLLWGARQTGKSSFLRSHYPNSIYIDLLNSEQLLLYTKSPEHLREKLCACQPEQFPVIIDEIQKVPQLLNEVHWLIENQQIPFILCGSSARRLKHESTNLLGGRAWKLGFYPLVSQEIPEFDMLKACQHGLLPKHYLADSAYIERYLQAYVDVYLVEEIRNEALVRNLASFARFLDVAGLTSGDMINMNNVARDCQAQRNTIQGYYQILVDTMLGYFIYPFHKKVRRDAITSMPKFYLFDIGIANYLARRTVNSLKGAAAGRAFEHIILMELIAYKGIHQKRFNIHYWRTKSGLEVDFILDDAALAVEVKISQYVKKEDLKGLKAFCEEFPSTKALVVSQDSEARRITFANGQTVDIIPWQDFLKQLWAGRYL